MVYAKRTQGLLTGPKVIMPDSLVKQSEQKVPNSLACFEGISSVKRVCEIWILVTNT